MKRIISLLALIIMAFSLTACSQTVNLVVADAVDGTLYDNYEAVKGNEKRNKLDENSVIYFKAIYFDFGEEISNDGQYRVVETEMTVPDWSLILDDVAARYIEDESIDIGEAMYECIENKEFEITKTVNLTLEKIDGVWKIIPNEVYQAAIDTDIFAKNQ